MSWWDSMTSQLVGDLIAGLVILGPALYLESRLDAWRQRQSEAREHRRKHPK